MSEMRCWRCERKLLELEIAPDVVIPVGITIKKHCERCGAMNAVPLDRVAAYALA